MEEDEDTIPEGVSMYVWRCVAVQPLVRGRSSASKSFSTLFQKIELKHQSFLFPPSESDLHLLRARLANGLSGDGRLRLCLVRTCLRQK